MAADVSPPFSVHCNGAGPLWIVQPRNDPAGLRMDSPTAEKSFRLASRPLVDPRLGDDDRHGCGVSAHQRGAPTGRV